MHIGQAPEEITGAVIAPIYQTTNYVEEAPGVTKGYDYTRADNPNFRHLEEAIASLEDGSYATVFSSGLGAATAILSVLVAGDHIVAGDDLYGGVWRLFTQVASRFGIEFTFVDGTEVKNFEQARRMSTKVLWMETPTNPLLKLTDLGAVAKISKAKKILTVVDNTFATPYFQRPLEKGIDLVLHSTTKYIGGHSDVVGGSVVTNDRGLKERLDFARKSLGLNPSPFDCWLTRRGLKTLGLRMERHQYNALEIANFLVTHPLVSKVYYPGLPSHPQYNLACSQMNGFGGMVSCEFNMPLEKMKKMISQFKLFRLAESLGGVESLVAHAATMTHASVPSSERQKSGLSDDLVRFSVGIEDAEDLTGDLETTLAKFS